MNIFLIFLCIAGADCACFTAECINNYWTELTTDFHEILSFEDDQAFDPCSIPGECTDDIGTWEEFQQEYCHPRSGPDECIDLHSSDSLSTGTYYDINTELDQAWEEFQQEYCHPDSGPEECIDLQSTYSLSLEHYNGANAQYIQQQQLVHSVMDDETIDCNTYKGPDWDFRCQEFDPCSIPGECDEAFEDFGNWEEFQQGYNPCIIGECGDDLEDDEEDFYTPLTYTPLTQSNDKQDDHRLNDGFQQEDFDFGGWKDHQLDAHNLCGSSMCNQDDELDGPFFGNWTHLIPVVTICARESLIMPLFAEEDNDLLQGDTTTHGFSTYMVQSLAESLCVVPELPEGHHLYQGIISTLDSEETTRPPISGGNGQTIEERIVSNVKDFVQLVTDVGVRLYLKLVADAFESLSYQKFSWLKIIGGLLPIVLLIATLLILEARATTLIDQVTSGPTFNNIMRDMGMPIVDVERQEEIVPALVSVEQTTDYRLTLLDTEFKSTEHVYAIIVLITRFNLTGYIMSSHALRGKC